MATLFFQCTHLSGAAPEGGQWLAQERAIGLHFDTNSFEVIEEGTGSSFKSYSPAITVLWIDADDEAAGSRQGTVDISFYGDPYAWDILIQQVWSKLSATFELDAADGTYRIEPLYVESRGITFPEQEPEEE